MKRALTLSFVTMTAACGPSTDDFHANPPPPPQPTVAPAAFENPGGMWTPPQLAQHVDTLKRLGLEIDPAALADPTSSPMGAIIWLGGCSASFVSAKGLIITNHHCALGGLQFNSTPEQNLLKDGYLAKTMADEKSNGPSARAYVTQKFTDVTARMRDGIEAEKDDKKRHDMLEQRQKDFVAECEKDRKEIRCSVVSFFGGEQYVLIEQLEIRDVRLVHAPAEGIGAFGGEIDNWRWPRHSGDYAFFRAYVGPDGKPADFDPKNVPYQPKHFLKVASKPLAKGDLVFVAGYPGQTTRLRSSVEVADAVDWYYPRVLQLCDDYIGLAERLGKESKELEIKANNMLRGLNNWRTNTRGMMDGLVKGGLKDQKAADEKQLLAWAAKNPEHGSVGQALTNLAAHRQKYQALREQDAAHHELTWMSTLLGAADTIVHMAEQRPKPDAERHPSLQERNHKMIRQRQEQVQRTYDRKIDEAKLNLAVSRAAKLPAGQQPEALRIMIPSGDIDAAAIAKAVKALYDGTQLGDDKRRVELFDKATTAELQKSKDPMIQLALKLRPLLQASEDRAKSFEGAVVIDRPKFAAALRASKDGVLAPDANSTLRVSYGTVRGYAPKPDAPVYVPFTKLSELVAKDTGSEPFNATPAMLEAAKKGPFGPYVHSEIGEVPVNFLADLDITGGNSGSATLNARGELVGLAFDGNYEAMASDWIFIPPLTRSIHVDIRFVFWMMDRVDGADHILTEMGVTPSL